MSYVREVYVQGEMRPMEKSSFNIGDAKAGEVEFEDCTGLGGADDGDGGGGGTSSSSHQRNNFFGGAGGRFGGGGGGFAGFGAGAAEPSTPCVEMGNHSVKEKLLKGCVQMGLTPSYDGLYMVLPLAGEIQKAYRKKSLQLHPDKHPPEKRVQMTEAFKKMKGAYDELAGYANKWLKEKERKL